MDNSKVEWTTHTFNPWIGCEKVSAGCKNCYAEAMDRRWKGGHWGPGSSRKPMSEAYWKQPLKWNKAAAAAGEKAKVFCASMADVFEGHPDTLPYLQRLFILINQTPNLIWQLLTKRPENILKLVPSWWIKHGFPPNVWIGTSVENQEAAATRIPYLLEVAAVVRFLSCEPLLGPVNLRHIDADGAGHPEYCQIDALTGRHTDMARPCADVPAIHWVIAGGESGHGARRCHPDWFRSLRDQCKSARIAFFFKQWGEWADRTDGSIPGLGSENVIFHADGKVVGAGSRFGGMVEEDWKENGASWMSKAGKKAAGRLLDGVEHNEFPKY